MTTPPSAEAYLHGLDGLVVMMPSTAAAALESRLDAIRHEVRGRNPEVDAVLTALKMAALHHRSKSGSASSSDQVPQPVPQLSDRQEWVSTQDAATTAGVSARAIRKAIADGRLQGQLVDGRWLIEPDSLEGYTVARAA